MLVRKIKSEGVTQWEVGDIRDEYVKNKYNRSWILFIAPKMTY